MYVFSLPGSPSHRRPKQVQPAACSDLSQSVHSERVVEGQGGLPDEGPYWSQALCSLCYSTRALMCVVSIHPGVWRQDQKKKLKVYRE